MWRTWDCTLSRNLCGRFAYAIYDGAVDICVALFYHLIQRKDIASAVLSITAWADMGDVRSTDPVQGGCGEEETRTHTHTDTLEQRCVTPYQSARSNSNVRPQGAWRRRLWGWVGQSDDFTMTDVWRAWGSQKRNDDSWWTSPSASQVARVS